jgi:four helix bundle protein
MTGGEMKYGEWSRKVPEEITNDALWKVEAYRLALFITDLGWKDASKLRQDARTVSLSDQLYRSLGSIGANLAEGYSRGTGRDRARFYEYSLGSAREARDWYYKARYILGERVTGERLDILVRIIRLLLKMVPDQRGKSIRENVSKHLLYFAEEDEEDSDTV